MNILYYLDNFPKLSESFIINEIYELTDRGHTVAVFALTSPEESVMHDEVAELDVSIHYADTPSFADARELVSAKVLNPRILKHAGFKTTPQQHAAGLHRAKQCIEFIEEIGLNLDVVHTHFATSATFPARYVASFYEVPCTVTTHAFNLYNRPNKHFLSHMFERVDRVVTISEYNRRYIRETITDETPVDIVHAGIRPEKFNPSAETVNDRILTVARFMEKKGLRYAIRAISNVVERIPEVDYHVVGSGPLEGEIRNQIAELGLEDSVTLLDNVSDDRLISEYDEAEVFLLPSVVAESGDRDGIPVVLMEAMAMETPPVSTTVSGIPELVDDEENGLLVEPRNPDALADAIVSLLRNRSRREAFGKRGRDKVAAEFNIASEVEKLERVFERVIRSPS